MCRIKTYTFTIWFDVIGEGEDEESLANSLYESGCSDAMYGVSNRKHSLSFDREDLSINEAIKSAVENIISSGCDIHITKIEVDNNPDI